MSKLGVKLQDWQKALIIAIIAFFPNRDLMTSVIVGLSSLGIIMLT